MVKPYVLILRAGGTNCDFETEWSLAKAGARPERVHINRIVRGEKKLSDYQGLVIPGGFSYGDDISAGKVLANKLRYNMWEEILSFIDSKKPVIGICNGFQVLVKAGLLPWRGKQSVTLGWNDSARFEARWVYLKPEKSVCPFFKGFPDIFRMPVAHAEGKFIAENRSVMDKMDSKKLIAMRYCCPDGSVSPEYPYNPNGSEENIAAICDESGFVLGLMPHPERALLKCLYPEIFSNGKTEEEGIGFAFFKNIVDFAAR